jgi:hypothetical protein
MKANEIVPGSIYVAKISGTLRLVRVLGPSPYGGYDIVNLETGRRARTRSAAKFRRPATKEETMRGKYAEAAS